MAKNKVYSDIEMSIAEQVIDSLRNTLNLYFGTGNTLGEVRVRDIGLYEKKTFKFLLECYTERMIYIKSSSLGEWGRSHFTQTEFKNITTLVSIEITDWLKFYDSWVKSNPQIKISDFRARRSKVLKYTVMLGVQWRNVKGIVNEELNKLKIKYKREVIYSFTTSEERLKIEERYPNKRFIDKAEFKKKLLENAFARIGENPDIKLDDEMLNMHIEWVTDITEDESSCSIRYGDLSGQELETVKTHHEKFIDYVTQQVFGDRGYLFGLKRENIPNAIAVNNYPGLSDFRDFMYARAEAEANRDGYRKEGSTNREYSDSDIDRVKKLNQRFVDNNTLTRYESYLRDNGIEDNDDKVKGSAFGYKIPDSDILKKLDERISEASKEAWEQLGPDAKEEDVVIYITNRGKDKSKEDGIDDTFVDPYVSKGYNKYLKDTYRLNSDKKTNKSKPRDTYTTKNHKGTWKYNLKDNRYYKAPEYNTTKAEQKNRTYKFERYHGEGDVASNFIPTYRTFSGHDMVVTVQVPISRNSNITKVIGAFQTITYSINNDKYPIRVLGDMNARRYVFGPRTVAGSIVLTVFDRHWMKELLGTYNKIKSETERYFLMDELPAFNITISCANEYGHNAKLALYGVTIVNEGQVMSINDVYTENTYQFFATNVEYLDRVEKTSNSSGKKTATTNLPIKGQTQGVDNNTNITPITTGDGTISTSKPSDETEQSVEEKIKKKMDEYDPLHKQKLDELQDAMDNYVNKVTDKDGELLYDADSIAKYMAEWERSENYRRVALYKDKVMYPLIEELDKNHEKGLISDENYAMQRKIIMGGSSLLNTSVIVKANKVEVDYQRNNVAISKEKGDIDIEVPKDVFKSAEETINEFNKERGRDKVTVVDLSQTPIPGEAIPEADV